MKGGSKAAVALQGFLTLNYGEMDCTVGVGKDALFVYVNRGKKHMDVIPGEWEGFTVEKKWIGKVKPL